MQRGGGAAGDHVVLIVEDDESLAHLIQRVLGQEGHQTARVGNGEEAIAWLKTHEANLVLLDYSLPDMHADRLIDLFEEHRIDAPFIVATGHGSETIAVEMMKRGARDYLVKGPSFLDLLGPLVTRVLSQVDRERRLSHAERALRESEERLRTVIEASNAGIWEWDPTAGIGYLSDEAYSITGIDRGVRPVDRETARAAIHPEDIADVKAAILAAISRHEPLRLEARMLRPDGECRWVTMSGKSRETTEGHPTRIAGSLLDITDRKRAELALEARARQQAAVAELGKQALEGTDIHRLLADAAQVAAQMLNVDCARLFEPSDDEAFAPPRVAFGAPSAIGGTQAGSGPDLQARLSLSLGEAVIVADYATDPRFLPLRGGSAALRGGVCVLVHGHATPYGVLGAFASRSRVFSQDDMHFLQAVANTLADAIERKRSEEDARRQQSQLAHVMRLNTMGKMVSELAHEINQPLYAIANYAAACREVLQSTPGAARNSRVEPANFGASESGRRDFAAFGRFCPQGNPQANRGVAQRPDPQNRVAGRDRRPGQPDPDFAGARCDSGLGDRRPRANRASGR